MLVDLHAHFPMHLAPGARERAHDQVRAWARRRWQARLIDLISRFANYQGPGDEPSVTEPLMRQGGVGVALSVLYAPLDEMDLDESYGAPPRGRYFADLLAELELVEDHAAGHAAEIAIAHSPSELDAHLATGTTTLIHAIEGGFQLGETEAEVRANVRALASRGVAYVTVAHLFWRAVATNAPALPFLPDWLYHFVFPQPDIGLSPLGAATVEAMAEEGILIDISHMSERGIEDVFGLLDRRDPERTVPVLATHIAYRFGKAEYCVSERTVSRVAERGGVLGCILCEHWIGDGLKLSLDSFEHSVQALCTHIDRIAEICGSFDHVAIGSDLDGYIKPALPGLGHMGRMAALQQALAERYGPADAEKIASANALRVLQAGWRTGLTG
jgi:microsomal dipeptidase-like Zn-dependent dipeptidase